MSELAKAYVQIIPTMEGVQGKLESMLGGEADSAGRSVGGKFGSALGGAVKIGIAAVGALAGATTAAGAALFKGASAAAEYGDNIDKMSQKMGLSATAYQEWDAVMQHSGTSMESLQASMKTLANAVENDNAAFGRLGITQEQIASMNNEELFSATITALQNVENETERTYLAGQLLGRGATELGALLNTSAEDTQAMKDRVHELGGVMSDEAVKAAAEFQDSLQDMQTAFSGLKRGLTAEFIPGIKGVMDGLTEIFAGNSGEGLALISAGVSSVIDTISNELPRFLELGSSIILSLVQAITDNLPSLLSAGAGALLSVSSGIIEQLPEIITAGLEIVITLAKGIADSLPEMVPTIVDVVLEIVDTLTDPDTLVALIEASIAIIIALANGLIEALPRLVEKAPEIVWNLMQALIEAAPKLLGAAWQLIETLAIGLTNSYGKLLDKGREIIDKIKEGFWEKVESAKNWGKELLGNLVSGITEKWDNVKSTVTGIWDKLVAPIKHSVPKEGPLKDELTWMPHMMANLAKGVKDNAHLVTDEMERAFSGMATPLDGAWQADSLTASVAAAGSHRFGGAAAGYGSRTNSVVVNVYGAEGQNEEVLARKIERIITQAIQSKEAAWA